MDVCTKWYNEVTDLGAHAVSFCTLQIDRDRCSRGLCSKSCSIPRNLVFYKGQRVFFLLTEPAIVNWIKMQIRCIAITTRKTFQRIPRIAKVLPDLVMSVKFRYKPEFEFFLLHYVIFLKKSFVDFT